MWEERGLLFEGATKAREFPDHIPLHIHLYYAQLTEKYNRGLKKF